jgi:hypothetical protein
VTFERHGIDHLSAGSLNLWIANPREWAVRYLAKEPDDGADPALWRGTAVEAGLGHWLAGRSIDQAQAAACDAFELNAVGDLSDDVEAERSLVQTMVDRACTWPTPGALTGTQLRIERHRRRPEDHARLSVSAAQQSRPPGCPVPRRPRPPRRPLVCHRQTPRLL